MSFTKTTKLKVKITHLDISNIGWHVWHWWQSLLSWLTTSPSESPQLPQSRRSGDDCNEKFNKQNLPFIAKLVIKHPFARANLLSSNIFSFMEAGNNFPGFQHLLRVIDQAREKADRLEVILLFLDKKRSFWNKRVLQDVQLTFSLGWFYGSHEDNND